ncbi:MAG: SMC-Scp complex subunit ScpB [Desulfobacterota bacterium]|nr:SMC-Scp complex subunit ScpB [Thermodesulfobacteriota bacterium]
MNGTDIRPILEAFLFVSDSPIALDTLSKLLPEWNEEAILQGLMEIKKGCEAEDRGLELVEVAGGYQLRTKPQWAQYVSRMKKAKPVKLSQSALETLAIIAYRQPIIRPTIEKIRGVDSGWVIRSLLEKGLIRIVGRKDIPGRPLLYGTTKTFLELFGLNSLSDLPTLKEIEPPPEPEAPLEEGGGPPFPAQD